MVPSRNVCFCLLLGCALLAAQVPGDDPVMKARAERAKAQGVEEGDLPPLPKGILEPPPLPPPETHVKDTPRGARTARVKASKAVKGKRAKGGRHAKGESEARRGKAEPESEVRSAKAESGSRKGKAGKVGKAPKTHKQPAKGGRKSSKKVKG